MYFSKIKNISVFYPGIKRSYSKVRDLNEFSYLNVSTSCLVLRVIAYCRQFFNYVQEDGFTYYKFLNF